MNIVWKKPDNSVAVTHLVTADDPASHAVELKARGDIPADWVVVGFNQVLPLTRAERDAWTINEVGV